jgi:TolB-like protein/DNA-binding winged helix-turn-helix (wHTH) protein/Flp pilus assembly protein TadD
MGEPENNLCKFGPFRLDLSERQLFRDGEPVSLTPRAFETLVMLVRKRGHVVEKDDLLKEVWKDTFVEEANISRHVWMLRKALGENESGQSYIETIPRRGYRFLANVKEESNGSEQLVVERRSIVQITAEVDDEVANTASPDVEHPTSSAEYVINEIKRHKRGALVLAAVVVTAALAAFVYFKDFGTRPQAITSIAVLPFVNVSADPEVEYLSDGLSESLLDRLSQLPQLKVIARSSSFKYRGENLDLRDVANKLGVQAIVMGRVVRRGDDLTIGVEMVDVRDNKQLWGEQYNRKAADALVVQQEIAQTVAEKLRMKLSGAQEYQLAKRDTVNPLAYELLLQGNFYRNKGTPEGWKKAAGYFEQAIAVDPTYALAYARLSRSYGILIAWSTLNPKEFRPKAEAAARKAVELDESLAVAHLSLAALKQFAWDWTAAEREFRRAIELNPNDAGAHESYSFYLSLTGQHEQALAEIKRAGELDPVSLFVNLGLARVFYSWRNYDQAIFILKKTLELDPNSLAANGQLGFTYAAKGMYPEAIASYQEGIKLGDNSPSIQVYLGATYAKAGEREKAQAILKRLQTSKEYVSPGELAVLYAALGEREQAFASLERAYAAHDLQLQYLGVDPPFDSLRSDPRFQDLVRRVGLPQLGS